MDWVAQSKIHLNYVGASEDVLHKKITVVLIKPCLVFDPGQHHHITTTFLKRSLWLADLGHIFNYLHFTCLIRKPTHKLSKQPNKTQMHILKAIKSILTFSCKVQNSENFTVLPFTFFAILCKIIIFQILFINSDEHGFVHSWGMIQCCEVLRGQDPSQESHPINNNKS